MLVVDALQTSRVVGPERRPTDDRRVPSSPVGRGKTAAKDLMREPNRCAAKSGARWSFEVNHKRVRMEEARLRHQMERAHNARVITGPDLQTKRLRALTEVRADPTKPR